ncbi:peptidase [Jannaschia seohaensis]|uniref:NlpC/P60 family putative phage cell wall peptidase n=1 Tax=Jannaschia seohaensis TaxID=475081 RepID=A0A2Y9AU92_9RHOB|nr:peptidase [Jannaschia seohaensis]PWJ19157.1 NlpC/P60 family putative phage cell wall peptidase [Jannaschia seohaensis]SSA45819.1 putative phage cell wall peptidase, NlpC/P60 family [Jannaschia seohaensis]
MNRVVNEARRWLGTPYMHQASVRGAGTDCLGLIRGVWRALYGNEPEVVPRYSADWAEPQRDEVLWRAALRHLVPVPPERALTSGECLLFRMRDGSVAKHLGIVGLDGPMPSFIHAYSGRGVVESPLSRPWVRRIAARFDFPA